MLQVIVVWLVISIKHNLLTNLTKTGRNRKSNP